MIQSHVAKAVREAPCPASTLQAMKRARYYALRLESAIDQWCKFRGGEEVWRLWREIPKIAQKMRRLEIDLSEIATPCGCSNRFIKRIERRKVAYHKSRGRHYGSSFSFDPWMSMDYDYYERDGRGGVIADYAQINVNRLRDATRNGRMNES